MQSATPTNIVNSVYFFYHIPPAPLHVLGTSRSLSYRQVSFKLIQNCFNERFIIHINSDEINKYGSNAFANWSAHVVILKQTLPFKYKNSMLLCMGTWNMPSKSNGSMQKLFLFVLSYVPHTRLTVVQPPSWDCTAVYPANEVQGANKPAKVLKEHWSRGLEDSYFHKDRSKNKSHESVVRQYACSKLHTFKHFQGYRTRNKKFSSKMIEQHIKALNMYGIAYEEVELFVWILW